MKEKILDFYMNNNKWSIYEVEQKLFWEDDGKLEEMSNTEYHFGRCKYNTQEIWLCIDNSLEQRKKTLYHELLHCYRGSYITFNDIEANEDFWCDISANSHDIIHSIIEEYVARKKHKKEEELEII